MTSHSAQSQTVERVFINIHSADPRLRGLLNEVFAYVAASRPEYDLRLLADHAADLLRVLGRENEQQKAHSPQQVAQLNLYPSSQDKPRRMTNSGFSEQILTGSRPGRR